MKTKKQVLAMFGKIQAQFAGKAGVIFTVKLYNNLELDYWAVEISLYRFFDYATDEHYRDRVEWVHYSHHDEENEDTNMRVLHDFLDRNGIKMEV